MRKLAAIMFTDIAGYTTLMSQDEEKALQLLQRNRALLKPIIEQFRGEWLKEIGDGTLSSFASAVDAVNCALEIQHILRQDPELSLRVGIHIGDVVFERGDVFGEGVNVASRIEPLAEPGGICVSDRVYDDIHNKPGIEATFLGEKRLKGVDRPVKVYAVTEKRAALREPEPAASLSLLRRKWAVAALGAAAAASLAVVALFYLLRGPDQEAALGAKSIAVLPFVNFSDSKDDEYFSDGITDDILTHLCKIGDLNVIARTSSMQYKGTDKRPREIAQELGVATILEGSVRRYGNKVRIVSQLIDARTEKHLWAETYDRDLTDIFAIQSDVAQQIAAALKATLTPEEKDYIEEKPTDNPEAYDCYLKGNVFFDRLDYEKAISLYEKAVDLDPTFALAYARLARAHLRMRYHGDLTPERLAMAKNALDKALALDPDHPEVHIAHGYYYYFGFKDWGSALEQAELGLKGQPNNAEINFLIGIIKRRQGKMEEAVPALIRAAGLDPRHLNYVINVSAIYLRMRNWAEAERYADQVILRWPEFSNGYYDIAEKYLSSAGDIEKARGVMQEALEKVDPSQLGRLVSRRSYIEILARDYQKALNILETSTADWFLRKADLYSYMGQLEQAATYFDSARVTYEKRVGENPDDYATHGYLGISYAGLGRREEAIREGKRAVEILPFSRDASAGDESILYLAIIYTMLGEHDAAIDQLEVLLSIPHRIRGGVFNGVITVPLLKLDPQWDPLREHPRFKALVEKYGGR